MQGGPRMGVERFLVNYRMSPGGGEWRRSIIHREFNYPVTLRGRGDAIMLRTSWGGWGTVTGKQGRSVRIEVPHGQCCVWIKTRFRGAWLLFATTGTDTALSVRNFDPYRSSLLTSHRSPTSPLGP